MLSDRRPVALGIAFGDTVIRAAVWRVGKVASLEDYRGEDATPAVVAHDGRRWAVGHEAAEASTGRCDRLRSRLNDPKILCVRDEPVNGVDTAARLLCRLMRGWQTALHPDRIVAVGTCVPMDFTFAQRDAWQAAFEEAGMTNLQVLHEPEAALLGSRLDERLTEEDTPVAIADFGGNWTTFTVLMAAVRHGRLRTRVLAQHVVKSGGRAVTERLRDWLQRRNPAVSHLEKRWEAVAEESKRTWSWEEEATVRIPDDLGGGTVNLSRDDMLEIMGGVVDEWDAELGRTLRAAGLRAAQVAYAVVTGGGSLLPLAFDVAQRLPLTTEAPDLAQANCLAFGAARYAALQAGLVTDLEYTAPTRPAVGVELDGGRFDPVLPPDWTAGDMGQRLYTNPEPNPKEVRFRLLQGFAEDAASNHGLKELPCQPSALLSHTQQLKLTLTAQDSRKIRVDVRDMRENKGLMEETVEVR